MCAVLGLTPVLQAQIVAPQPQIVQSPATQTPVPQSPATQTPVPPTSSAAGARVLTLDEALGIAESKSEQVLIATAGVDRAKGTELRARSEKLPQLNASATYDRALKSEFEGLFDGGTGGPPCPPLMANPAAPLGDRVTELERAYACIPSSNPFGNGGGTDGGTDEDTELPFGRANTYRLNLNFSQNVYAGGRIQAQQDRARVGRANADLGLSSTRAQLSLDVATAYYLAALSDRLVSIAEETLQQSQATADQTRAQREAGRLSEFDLLRAQVAVETQRPDVIRRRADRDIAYLRLKQLLDLPLDADVRLADNLNEDSLAPATRFAAAVAQAEAGLDSRERIAIAQASNDVKAREADVTIARSQRLPAIAVNSAYGLVAYPTHLPAPNDFRTNWSVGASVSVPVFTGGRIKADETIARADLAETHARLQLTRELATLDTASAMKELESARAQWQASAGTVQQAQRAYEIAELRYREGISTQLELSDARLLLRQAQGNRAQAAKDLQVARVRLALLPELPLDATSAAGGASTAAAQQQSAQAAQQAAQQQAQQRAAQQGAGTAGAPGTTGVTGTGGTTGVPR